MWRVVSLRKVLGSNIFNILLGLALPWCIKALSDGVPFALSADDPILSSVCILVLCVVGRRRCRRSEPSVASPSSCVSCAVGRRRFRLFRRSRPHPRVARASSVVRPSVTGFCRRSCRSESLPRLRILSPSSSSHPRPRLPLTDRADIVLVVVVTKVPHLLPRARRERRLGAHALGSATCGCSPRSTRMRTVTNRARALEAPPTRLLTASRHRDSTPAPAPRAQVGYMLLAGQVVFIIWNILCFYAINLGF